MKPIPPMSFKPDQKVLVYLDLTTATNTNSFWHGKLGKVLWYTRYVYFPPAGKPGWLIQVGFQSPLAIGGFMEHELIGMCEGKHRV